MRPWRKCLESTLPNGYFSARQKEMEEECEEVVVLGERVLFLSVQLHDDGDTSGNRRIENSRCHDLLETLYDYWKLLSENGATLRRESKW